MIKLTELKQAIRTLEGQHATGKLILMEVVNRLYDLERDHELAPEEITIHLADEDIKENYLDISRPKIKRR